MPGLSGTLNPPATMFWSLLSLLVFTVVSGTPIGDQDEDIQVQENFEAERMFGKWYDIAIGTTCIWMKNYKEKFSMGTLVLGPGPSIDQISTASTRLRQGDCTHISGEYQKTSTPGKYTYYNPKWDVSIRSYVLRTNYEEYAVVLMKKKSSFGPSTTLKLYGRSPDLREDLIEAFQQHMPLLLPVPLACTGAASSWCVRLGRWGDGQDGGRRNESFCGWDGKAMYQSGFHQLPVSGVLSGLSGQCIHYTVLG
uniref:Alpha-1-microglobulin/bikunin precursor n=1 Tax=Athene cunicularia TaxID=194338 RepID=A0A663NF55_ATHCN